MIVIGCTGTSIDRTSLATTDAGSGTSTGTTCTPDGNCTQCTDDGCVDCNDYYDFDATFGEPESDDGPVATLMGGGGSSGVPGSTTTMAEMGTIKIWPNGDVTVKSAGGVVTDIAGAAENRGGKWVLTEAGKEAIRRALGGAGGIVIQVAKCIGPIATLLLIGQMANAGMNIAFGPAAAQIGVRTQECQDRFLKLAGGISCLQQQPASKSCADTVAACPDAFVGANLYQSCSTEPAYQALIDALVAALQATAARPGGAGYLAGGANQIDSSIKDGSFATNPSLTCSMRDNVRDCTFYPAVSPFTPDPTFLEAQKCWDDAWRSVFSSKWKKAMDCCTTNGCRSVLQGMRDC